MRSTLMSAQRRRVHTLSELRRRQIAHLHLPHVRLYLACAKIRLSVSTHRFKCLEDHGCGSPRPQR